MYNAPDINLMMRGCFVEAVYDTDKLFERARAKEVEIVTRQRDFDILGRPRYVVYWKEVPNVITDEHELL